MGAGPHGAEMTAWEEPSLVNSRRRHTDDCVGGGRAAVFQIGNTKASNQLKNFALDLVYVGRMKEMGEKNLSIASLHPAMSHREYLAHQIQIRRDLIDLLRYQ